MQHSQSVVQTHRAGEWLGDPVNERLWFGGITRLGSCHMKLCHSTRAVLHIYMVRKWGSEYDSWLVAMGVQCNHALTRLLTRY